jgi:hypothetical protein
MQHNLSSERIESTANLSQAGKLGPSPQLHKCALSTSKTPKPVLGPSWIRRSNPLSQFVRDAAMLVCTFLFHAIRSTCVILRQQHSFATPQCLFAHNLPLLNFSNHYRPSRALLSWYSYLAWPCRVSGCILLPGKQGLRRQQLVQSAGDSTSLYSQLLILVSVARMPPGSIHPGTVASRLMTFQNVAEARSYSPMQALL